MRRQEELRARERERRERELRERESRERSYNQQLYNKVHSVSSATNQSAQQQQQQQQPQQPQSQPSTTQPQSGADDDWEALRQMVLKQISLNDQDSASLVKFIYTNFPPKGKIRVTNDSIAQIAQLQRSADPSLRKKLKMLLLKVIQDYHPDKVDEELGVKWKTISEDIVKRVTKYYEALK